MAKLAKASNIPNAYAILAIGWEHLCDVSIEAWIGPSILQSVDCGWSNRCTILRTTKYFRHPGPRPIIFFNDPYGHTQSHSRNLSVRRAAKSSLFYFTGSITPSTLFYSIPMRAWGIGIYPKWIQRISRGYNCGICVEICEISRETWISPWLMIFLGS